MTYRRGAVGPEVHRIQTRLTELGFYHGPLDGCFGGGTESAVVRFQCRERLTPDGAIGPLTWARLFPAVSPPAPAIATAPLADRCLALTAAFETGLPFPDCFAAVAGDFDGQGISFGALQWNLGSGTLQPLLAAAERERPGLLDEVCHTHASELREVLARPLAAQLAWARSIQSPRHQIDEPWLGLLKTLGRRPECQNAQRRAAAVLIERARKACRTYRVRSERALALLFDIEVQNGGIRRAARTRIRADVAALPPLPPGQAEIARLRIIANRRAEACLTRWIEDVRRRKLTIADGHGVVHGRWYDLEEQYGLSLAPADRNAAPPE